MKTSYMYDVRFKKNVRHEHFWLEYYEIAATWMKGRMDDYIFSRLTKELTHGDNQED